jgi:hypothetical protein
MKYITPYQTARDLQNHYVTLIYRRTGQGYKYSMAKEYALDHVDKELKRKTINDSYFISVKKKLEKL